MQGIYITAHLLPFGGCGLWNGEGDSRESEGENKKMKAKTLQEAFNIINNVSREKGIWICKDCFYECTASCYSCDYRLKYCNEQIEKYYNSIKNIKEAQ